MVFEILKLLDENCWIDSLGIWKENERKSRLVPARFSLV